jgi:hypothetical protein
VRRWRCGRSSLQPALRGAPPSPGRWTPAWVRLQVPPALTQSDIRPQDARSQSLMSTRRRVQVLPTVNAWSI